MDGIHTMRFPVPASAIDALGHVNNIAYVQWMQDVALDHCLSVGWPIERFLEAGFTFVARSHFVEYLRPAFEGEPLSVNTWVLARDQRGWPRRYAFIRDSDRKVVARAETIWVCVDLKTGRPMNTPPSMDQAFKHILTDQQAESLLGLAAPAR